MLLQVLPTAEDGGNDQCSKCSDTDRSRKNPACHRRGRRTLIREVTEFIVIALRVINQLLGFLKHV